jgi:phosphate transport system substrate-binding protein
MTTQNHAAPPTNRFRSRASKLAALAALAILSLAACGSDPTSATEPAGAEPGSSANASGLACPAGKLSAEGSSAQANAITEVIADYNAECGDKATIEYNPTGSGAGIKSFYNGLVDFAGSDSALKSEEKDGVIEADKAKERCQNNPAWNLPMVVGPVAFAYNIDGVDKLVLNAETLAEIFNGTIKTWNDPAIRALNGSVNLPDQPIQVFHLSKGYRDNAIFQSYLKVASHGAWTTDAGETFTGGVGTEMKNPSDLADKIRARSGAISYTGWLEGDRGYATARIDSGTGAVPLTEESAANAIPAEKIAGAGNDLVLNLDVIRGAPSASAYPLVYVSYYIVCSKGNDPSAAAAIRAFLTAAATDAQSTLKDTGAVPLSPSLRARMLQAVAAIS